MFAPIYFPDQCNVCYKGSVSISTLPDEYSAYAQALLILYTVIGIITVLEAKAEVLPARKAGVSLMS